MKEKSLLIDLHHFRVSERGCASSFLEQRVLLHTSFYLGVVLKVEVLALQWGTWGGGGG